MASVAKVHRLELTNFKSYNGKVVIGPLHDFDCIVGPNGAGKSNIMDALSFVLGSAATTLRMNRPEDLINNKCKKGEASVAVVMRTPSGQETTFTRKVNSKGQTTPLVDGHVVSEKDFAAHLRKHKIGARTNSFLVFQHEVDSLGQKKAKELTELIEEVSGSGELKSEYNEKKKEMEKANEELAAASSTKRTAIAEVNQMRLHKKEAERFEEVNNRLQGERRDLALVELFHIEVSLNKQKNQLKNFEEELNKLQTTVTNEDSLKKMKKEYGELHKNYLGHMKNHREAATDLREKRMTLDRITASIEHYTKRLAREREELDAAKESKTVRSKETARLQEQLKVQEAALAAFEEQCKKEDADAAKRGSLTPAQLAEYKQLKKEADCQTITLRQQLELSKRKGDTLAEGMKQLKLTAENQEANRAEVVNNIRRSEARIAECRAKLAELEKSAAELQAKEVEARAALAQVSSKSRARDEELKRLQSQLHELRHTKDDSRQGERAAEVLASLRALHPGVRGRLVDLCSIPNQRYRNAVTVALGKNLEGIVVDTTATAMACVRYLKEQRVPPMTFLPLSSLTGKAVDDRLRTFGGTCKPVVDVIKFESWLEPAIRYSLGQTLVCDTMIEAKNIAYGQSNGERFKVVTLDGTMLLKNGSIQGGQSNVEARARKWDEQLFEKLVEAEEKLRAEGGAEADETRLLVEAKEAATQVAFTKARIGATKEEIAGFESKLKTANAELSRQDANLANIKKRISDLEPQIIKNDQEKKQLDDEVKAKESLVFADFQKRVGIPNVAEFEERESVLAKNRAERRQQFVVLIHKLNTSIEAEAKRVGVKDPKAVEAAVQKTEEELRTCRKDLAQYQKIVEEGQTKVDRAQAEVSRTKLQVEKMEETIRNTARASEADIRRIAAAQKAVTMAKTGCEAFRLQRLSLFQRCRMEDIDLPVASSEEATRKKEKQGEAAQNRKRGRVEDGEDEGSSEGIRVRLSEAFTSFSETDGSRKGAKEMPVCIDFSTLPESLRRTAGDKTNFLAHKQRCETIIDQLERELESIAPNLKATDKFSSSEAKLGATSSSLEAAREKARKALSDFTRVKEQRVQKFMSCFDRIQEGVDRVYRELTMSTRTEGVHGSAYLSLEDPEEPYNAGTKYHATPPMKRFMTIDLLSGGERTMAALALLFAIHQISPAPFFVLDEVDAALDVGNVQKLAQYLHSHRYDCQFLVVSLKDQLYHMADSLVGVYKDIPHESSGILTLDLRSVPS